MSTACSVWSTLPLVPPLPPPLKTPTLSDEEKRLEEMSKRFERQTRQGRQPTYLLRLSICPSCQGSSQVSD